MSGLTKTVLGFVGLSCIFLACFGLLAASTGFVFFLDAGEPTPEKPYFKLAGISMSLVCIVCCLLLLFIGIQLVRLRSHIHTLLVRLLLFEVVYFLLMVFLPGIFGARVLTSFGAAMGVANGGLMPQLITLFFLWGPYLTRRANREIELQRSAGEMPAAGIDTGMQENSGSPG